MKIQYNNTNKIEEVPLNKAQRLINKGLAHIVKEEIKTAKVKKIANGNSK